MHQACRLSGQVMLALPIGVSWLAELQTGHAHILFYRPLSWLTLPVVQEYLNVQIWCQSNYTLYPISQYMLLYYTSVLMFPKRLCEHAPASVSQDQNLSEHRCLCCHGSRAPDLFILLFKPELTLKVISHISAIAVLKKKVVIQ